SHNPFEDNGVKVFGKDGAKLGDDAEAQIERRVLELLPDGAMAHRDAVPDARITAANTTGFPERYLELLMTRFPSGRWMQGMRIIMDCANGATSDVAQKALGALGAELRVMHAQPSGSNINAGCGAVHLETLVDAVNSHSADFGVAFDGDADRS